MSLNVSTHEKSIFEIKSNIAVIGRIRRIFAFLICVLIAIPMVLPIATCAQKSETVVRVGWYESPFNIIDKNGKRSGYAYEYQRKIADYTGWKYEYIEGSWSDLLQMLIDGEIDLLSDVSYTEERAENILFTALPMGSEEYYLYVEPGVTGYTSGNYKYFNEKNLA